MKTSTLVVGLISIALIIGMSLFLISRDNKDISGLPISQTVTPSSQTDTSLSKFPVNSEEDILRAGGSSYRDPQGIYSFLYPSDYTLDTQNDGQYIRVYKRGRTQTGQTEMFDGVIVVFEAINLNSQNLNEWLDARIEESTFDGTLEVIEAKKPIRLNNYPGYTYTVRGLGTSEYIVVQKDTDSSFGVSITLAVNDPENIGYQKEVDAILSTLQIQK
jgi:hypothetical protein